MEYNAAVSAVVHLILSVFRDEAREIGRRLIVATDSKNRQDVLTDQEHSALLREIERRLEEQTSPYPEE